MPAAGWGLMDGSKLTLTNYTVVMVRPSRPQNLGSVCRVLQNFGSPQLVVVGNEVDLTSVTFQKTARHARNYVEEALFVDTLEEALGDLTYAVATTARNSGERNPRRVCAYPEDIPWSEVGSRPGLVFGPESTGLANDEILQCDLVVMVPTDPRYVAMNLSHAVAVLSYHAYRATTADENLRGQALHEPAALRLKDQLDRTFERYVDQFCTPEKRTVILETFHNVLRRGNPTEQEVLTLIGAVRSWEWHWQHEQQDKNETEDQSID